MSDDDLYKPVRLLDFFCPFAEDALMVICFTNKNLDHYENMLDAGLSIRDLRNYYVERAVIDTFADEDGLTRAKIIIFADEDGLTRAKIIIFVNEDIVIVNSPNLEYDPDWGKNNKRNEEDTVKGD